MYTLIEIFDAKQYENILAVVSLKKLNKVIYLGSKEIMTQEKKQRLSAFFKAERLLFPCEFIYIERDNAALISNTLENIIKSNKNCIFDVTGGEDVILTIVGQISLKHNIPIIRVDAKEKKLIHIFGKADKISFNLPTLSSDNSLLLQGAIITSKGVNIKSLKINELNDIKDIYKINSDDCETYSIFCNIISEFITDDKRYLDIDISLLKMKERKFNCNTEYLLDSLINKKLLKIKVRNSRKFVLEIKNSIVFSCLSKAGNVLELYTAMALSEIDEITDISVGTSVDWDFKKDYIETQNEIDVIAMNGTIPIFISCKNGEVRKESLYEIDTLSRALGGAYTKKVLVATYISKNPSSKKHFIKRAEDMEIGLVWNAHKKTYEDFVLYLKNVLL